MFLSRIASITAACLITVSLPIAYADDVDRPMANHYYSLCLGNQYGWYCANR